jgi:hypothetical protein
MLVTFFKYHCLNGRILKRIGYPFCVYDLKKERIQNCRDILIKVARWTLVWLNASSFLPLSYRGRRQTRCVLHVDVLRTNLATIVCPRESMQEVL